MQPSAPDGEDTRPPTTPDASMAGQRASSPAAPASPDSAEATSSGATGPLAAEAARRIADVINEFKRDLSQRDGAWAHVQGSLELALTTSDASQTFILAIAPDEQGGRHPVTVHAAPKKPEVVLAGGTAPTTQPACKPTRRASDADLEEGAVSRKKRKLGQGSNETNKRPRDSEDDVEKRIPLITKEDLDHFLAKLQEDIRDDTTEAAHHLQHLLRRFKEESHEHAQCDSTQSQAQQPGAALCSSIRAAGAGPDVSFPSSDLDHDDANASIAEVVRRETALISRQVKWVEECRRAANDVHVKREDTWRTSSAGFHDQQRQDRENFQNRMLHESAMHSQTLNQILNEVKAIGLYAQNMKWETPSYLIHAPNTLPQIPTPPAFPSQQAPPAFPTQPTRTPSSTSKPSVQQKHFTWKTGRGPGTQNG